MQKLKKITMFSTLVLALALAAPYAFAKDNINIDNQSNLNLDYKVLSKLNSGLNKTIGNNDFGQITTGDSMSQLQVDTTGNFNDIEVKLDNLFNSEGGVTASDIDIDNQNDAIATHELKTKANTGLNKASGNDSGCIETGVAGAAAEISTVLNSNLVKISRTN